LKKGQKIPIEHAEFFKDDFETLYIDYAQTENIPDGTIIDIDNGSIVIEVQNTKGKLIGKVKKEGLVLINRHIDFE
jgi:pyruvate kinase